MSRSGSISEAPGKRLVHSELLCYAATHVHSNTQSSLTECLIDFYEPNEIFTAREVLRKEYDALLNNLTKIQRRFQAPTDKQSARPFAEDISSWTLLLDRETEKRVQFYALDISKVPPCPPEEANLFSVIARIRALERKIDASQVQVLGLSNPPEAASSAAAKEVHVPSSSSSRPAAPSVTRSSGNRPDNDSTQVKTAAPPRNSGQATSSGSSVQPPRHEEVPWSTVVAKNKRKIQERRKIRSATKDLQTVVGKSSESSGVIACPPIKHIFVHKVSRSCTTDIIRKHLQSKNIQPIDVKQTSKQEWLNASFKVSLDEKDFEKTFQEEFWPCGIHCREWLSYVPRQGKGPRASSAHPRNEASNSAPSAPHVATDSVSGDGVDIQLHNGSS